MTTWRRPPPRLSFALFATPIGACALAWGAEGIVRIWLPEADEAAMRRRVLHRFADADEIRPPPGIDLAVADMRALLEGRANDLSRIALDMREVPDFNRRVYAVARAIPPGETRTYGEVAGRLGDPAAARAVGAALGANPFPIVVPCHRVLAAGGRAGGFSARGGVTTKLKILAIEKARIGGAPNLFDGYGGLPLAARG